MPRFTLELELENDAMQTGDDIGRALRHAANMLEGLTPRELLELEGPARGFANLRDANGNTCGRWEIRRTAEEHAARRELVGRVEAGSYGGALALCGSCGWRGTPSQLRAAEEYSDEGPGSYSGRREDIDEDGREFCPACDEGGAAIWTPDDYPTYADYAAAVESETGARR